MSRGVRLVLQLCMSVMLAVVLSVSVCAGEYTFSFDDGTADPVQRSFDEMREALPDELADELDGISLTDAAKTSESLADKLDIGTWAGKIFDEIEKSLPQVMPSLSVMLSLVILMAASQSVLPDSPALKKAFIEYAGLFASVEVFRMTSSVLEMVQSYLGRMCEVMNFFVPVIEAVCLIGGKLTEKTVTGGGMILLITLIGNFNTAVLVPLTYVLFTLSAVTMTCPEVKLGGMVSSLRKFIMRLWSVMGIVFSFLLGIQTLLAKSADNLAARTVKFALGSFVPVAGGILSEAFSTVSEGMSFIRQAAGIGGILLILAMLLPGIIPLALYKLALAIASSAAELLGVTSAAGLFGEIRGIAEFLLAVVLVTSLLFLLALILFTKTQTG